MTLHLLMRRRGGAISAPSSDFDWLPFSITRGPVGGFSVGSFDLQTHANISVTGIYYVDVTTGNDGNTGADWANALKSLSTALGKADVNRVYVAKGYYYRSQSWSGVNPSRSIEVIGDLTQGAGDAVYMTSDCHNQLGAWSLDTNHYEATDGGRTVRAVWDNANQDAHGHATPLTLRASEAEVDANANSWYQDATHVYIRTSDDREPDSDIWTMESATPCRMARDDQTLYVEDIVFRGGYYVADIENASATGGAKFYAKSCTFGYASRAGVAGYPSINIDGCTEVGLQNVTAIRSELDDGIDYDDQNGVTPRFFEIDCEMFNNGTGTTDQGSTSHGGCVGVRVNGEYHDQPGQCIADVDAGAKIWCLGTKTYDSATNDNFWIEDAGSELWLDTCEGDASGDYDITAGAGSTARYFNFGPSGFTTGGAGTVETYAP